MKLAQFNQNGELLATCDFECKEAPTGWVNVDSIDYQFNAIKDGAPIWIEPEFNIDAYKSEKYLALKSWHDAQTKNMKAKYSASEVESFLDKRNEALAWSLNQAAPTPYIDAMSGGDAATRLILLNSILDKVKAAAQLEAYVLYIRDQIEASSTKEQIDSITSEINV